MSTDTIDISRLLVEQAADAVIFADRDGTIHVWNAAAEALFREGRALIKHGKLAAGCDKLEASEKLESSVGTLLNLGDCRERLGKPATAWAAFRKAEAIQHRKVRLERRGRRRVASPGPKGEAIRIAEDMGVAIPAGRHADHLPTSTRKSKSQPRFAWSTWSACRRA